VDARNSIWIEAHRGPKPWDGMILGQFLEHFHRQSYGGVFVPGSSRADSRRPSSIHGPLLMSDLLGLCSPARQQEEHHSHERGDPAHAKCRRRSDVLVEQPADERAQRGT
jgi:hypothetical protein